MNVFAKRLRPAPPDAIKTAAAATLGIPVHEVAEAHQGLSGSTAVVTTDGQQYRIDVDGALYLDGECRDSLRLRLPHWDDRT
jgi:hypothetical protein